MELFSQTGVQLSSAQERSTILKKYIWFLLTEKSKPETCLVYDTRNLRK